MTRWGSARPVEFIAAPKLIGHSRSFLFVGSGYRPLIEETPRGDACCQSAHNVLIYEQMKHINWNTEKSLQLKELRGICFEDVVYYIEKNDILDDYLHPNQKKYPEQRIMIIGINDYAYLLPYVEDAEEIFLKTIIPSRKATDIYLEEKNEDQIN